MSTNYIAPIWRMPRNANNTPVNKLSNYSIKFGTNEVINFDSYTLPDKYTISIWLNPDASYGTDYGYYIGGTPTAGQGFAIGQGGNAYGMQIGELYFYFGGSTSTLSGVVLPQNEWSHVLLVVDKTFGSQGKIETYLNNNLESTTTSFSSTPVSSFTSISMIGANKSNASQWNFSGEISQCCIFDYNLNLDQRTYLYNLNNPMAITGGEPIAYYPLGDNSNPNAIAGYPNISVGADSVFDFDGSTQFINAGSTSYLNNATQMSCSIWFNIDVAAQNDGLIADYSFGGAGHFALYTKSASGNDYTFRLSVPDSTADDNRIQIDGRPFTAGNWHNLIFTYNAGTILFYADGSLVSATAVGSETIPTSLRDSTGTLSIGEWQGINLHWDGKISNAQIWTTELSSSQVETLYNNGQPLMTGTQPQEANLKGWYKLNQSANWEADSSGNWQIPDAVSAYPQSFDFTGVNGVYVDAGNNDNINFTSAFSTGLWFKTTSSATMYTSHGSASVIKYFVQFYAPTNRLRLRIYDGGGGNVTVDNTQVFNDGKWHHLAFTTDGTISANKVIVYFDGQPLPTTGTLPNNGIKNLTSGSLKIGAYVTTQNTFDGQLSNFQTWNTELSSSQVETLYNNGTPLTTAIATDNLKAWYKLDNTEYFNNQDKWIVDNDAITPFYNNALKFINKSFTSGNALTIYSGADGGQPANLTFGASDSFSISTWYWTENTRTASPSPPGNPYLFTMRGSYSGPGFQAFNRLETSYLASRNSQIISYTLRDDNNVSAGVSSGLSTSGHPENGAWVHLVGVVDRTAQTLQLFVNTKGTSTSNISALGGFEGLNGIVIGNDPFNSGRYYYEGRQSNFAIFNKALTQSEIETLYNNGTPEENISFSPVSWWKLDNLSTGIQDSAGGGNNITAASWMTVVESPVNANIGVSSGMTEQNLVNNNVSVLNGESTGMNTTNLVTSNISRTQPYSNYSFNFDAASSDYFDLGGLQGTALQPSNATLVSDGFSVSMWVNVDSITNYGLWQNDGLGQTNYTGLLFQINPSGELNIGYNNNAGAGGANRKNYITSSSQITSTNTWYHVVAIYKGIAVTPGLYVNGVEVTSFTSSGTATSLAYSASAKGSIGTVRNAVVPLDGKISNCACFNRTLTQDEVLNIYNNGVPQDLQAVSTFSNNIVAWWPMDEHSSYYDGTDWVIRDIENGNDGDGANTGNVDDLVGNAPGSEASGTGTNLTIADLKGNMESSKNNAYSINMADYGNPNGQGVTPASSGRTTDVP